MAGSCCVIELEIGQRPIELEIGQQPIALSVCDFPESTSQGLAGTSLGTCTVFAAFTGAAVFGGTAEGLATVSAHLIGRVYFAGSSAGSSTATCTMNAPGSFSGASQGTSTAGATLLAAGALSGAAAGDGAATATFGGHADLAGAADGVATAASTFGGYGALAGSSAGTSTATAALAAPGTFAGTAAGIATASATLLAAGSLAGTSAGDAIVSATIGGYGALAGASAGTSTATAAFTDAGAGAGEALTWGGVTLTWGGAPITWGTVAGGAFAGTSAGSSTSSASFTGVGALAGASAGVATPTATLGGSCALAGSSAGTSAASATLSAPGDFAGTAAGAAIASATISGVGAIAGSASGVSSATATLSAPGDFAGTADGVATATAAFTASGALAGASAGVATAAATLTGAGAFAATSAGASIATAAFTGSAALTGASAGISTASSTLGGSGSLAGAAAGTSTASAALFDSGFTGLLDELTVASDVNNAYSVSHLLRAGHTAGLYEVQRHSDDTTQVIDAAASGSVDQAALAAFCAGTTGSVRTLYDQTGNGRDLTQTTRANQPLVYESGAVVVRGAASTPAMRFNGTSYLTRADSSGFAGNEHVTFAFNFEFTSGSTDAIIFAVGQIGSGTCWFAMTNPSAARFLSSALNGNISFVPSPAATTWSSHITQKADGVQILEATWESDGSALSSPSNFNGTNVTNMGTTQTAMGADYVGDYGTDGYMSTVIAVQAALAGDDLTAVRDWFAAISLAPGEFTGTTTGVATAVATLAASGALAGTAAGVATAAATLTGDEGAFTGTSTGTSTATASLGGSAAVSGSSAGSSAATASFTGEAPLIDSLSIASDVVFGYSVSDKLVAAYTGDAYLARRHSDDATQAIGFVGNLVDTASLAAFGAGDTVSVQTLYDQTGNGRDLTNATEANQPIVFESGAVVVRGTASTPAMRFNGTSHRLVLTGAHGIASNGELWVSIIDEVTGTGVSLAIGGGGTTSVGLTANVSTRWSIDGNGGYRSFTGSPAPTTFAAHIMVKPNGATCADTTWETNGSALSQHSIFNGTNTFAIGNNVNLGSGTGAFNFITGYVSTVIAGVAVLTGADLTAVRDFNAARI